MPAHLELPEAAAGRTIPCGHLTTIGRDPQAVVNLDDPRLSRQHAIIRRLARDRYYLLDLGSRNGTVVNGRRLSTPVLLQDGDELRLGDTVMRFRLPVGAGNTSRDLPALAETVANSDLGICTLTVLVADLRQFSLLSEKLPIRALSELMSSWFSEVQQAIEDQHGELDKFMGDGVLAYWRHQDDAASAVNAALASARAIAQVTGGMHQRFGELPQPLRVGAGIHTGQAAFSAGVVNTALGDTINLAFRLEEASKELSRDLVLSQTSHRLVSAAPAGTPSELAVRGHSQAIRVHAYTWDEVHAWLSKPG